MDWKLEDIDLQKAFEVIPSQDPETALRFNLPVPNWLDDTGKPRFSDPSLEYFEGKKSPWRYVFWNDKDQCKQDVRIDGTGVITVMGFDPAHCAGLARIVAEHAPDVEQLTPRDMTDILDIASHELGLKDCYDNPRTGVDNYMHPYLPMKTTHPQFGAFLPRPSVSTAVYIPGAGAFLDGPTPTPQRFGNGAFILFPGWRREELTGLTAADIRSSQRARPKLVQADVFVATRAHPDNRKIDIAALAGGTCPAGPQPH